MSEEAAREGRLAGEQLARLQGALLGAFDPAGFERVVRFALEILLHRIAPSNADFDEQVFAVIDWCERHDRIPELLVGAFNANNKNRVLKALVQDAQGWPLCKAKGLTLYKVASAEDENKLEARACLFAEPDVEAGYLVLVQGSWSVEKRPWDSGSPRDGVDLRPSRQSATSLGGGRGDLEDRATLYFPLPALRLDGGRGQRLRLDPAALLEEIRGRGGVLVCGGAGAGKSALLAQTACVLAAKAPERRPLPLLLPLGTWDGSGSLLARLMQHLQALSPQLAPHLPAYLAHGRLVLLLDGLDDPLPAQGGEVVRLLKEFRRAFPEVTIVSTARGAGAAGDFPVEVLALQPLDVDTQEALVGASLDEKAALALLEQLAGGRAAFERARDTGKQPHLLGLARTPLLLSWLIDLYAGGDEQQLLHKDPDFCGSLVHAAACMLWEREARRPGSLAHSQAEVFGALAEQAAALRKGEGQRGLPTLEAAAGGGQPLALLAAAESAGLLEIDPVRFAHPLLADCFGALALRAYLAGGGDLRALWPQGWYVQSGWERPAVFLAASKEDAGELLQSLGAANPLVAARCLRVRGELAESEAERSARAAVRVQLTAAAVSTVLPLGARSAAGDALSYVRDTRAGVGLRSEDDVPDIAWRLVGEGAEAFAIAAYPITNMQFRSFARARGYSKYDFWSPEGWAWREGRSISEPLLRGGVFDLDNHPAVYISFHEAQAFCAWLSSLLGCTVTLPTGAQWALAAGAGDGRRYPHGDDLTPEHANYRAGKLHTTSAVGLFPLGASPWGVLDLAGNVWEWTLDGAAAGAAEGNLLRGGSYDENPSRLRCTATLALPAGERNERVGFRVVTEDGAVLAALSQAEQRGSTLENGTT